MSVQTEIDRIITAVGAAYDAVEEKGGTLPTSETVANLAEAISSIPKETHQAVEQATPSLTLNAATGVVTAEATQAAGLVAAGTKKATMQLATQAEKTVTPTEAEQTAVASGKYTTGDVVVAAVPTEEKTVELSMPSGNQTVSPSSGKFLSAVTVKKPATMLPENIKKGVSIGGVVGTLESGGGGSTSETWVLNNSLTYDPLEKTTINFVSNGESYAYISYEVPAVGEPKLKYGNNPVTFGNVFAASTQIYRKVTFAEAPTGDLLTWLEANGVKQPANLAVQPSKDVTITSNGTTEITPDAPYDVMEKANVTVDVAADYKIINIPTDASLRALKSYTLTHNLGRKPRTIGVVRTSNPTTKYTIVTFQVLITNVVLIYNCSTGSSSSYSLVRKSDTQHSEIPTEGFGGDGYYIKVGNANESTVDFKFGETSSYVADLSGVTFIVF